MSNIQKYKDELFIKVRSTGRLIKAKLNIQENKAEVILEEDETGISPGQACVFYSTNKLGDKVLVEGGYQAQSINFYPRN